LRAAAEVPDTSGRSFAAEPARSYMPKDQLFLLPAAFPDPALGPGTFHCIECARIEGLLSYQPALRAQIDVHYIPHARPRVALIALLGEPHQSCPTIVVGSSSPSSFAPLRKSSVTDRYYCTGVDAVTAYLVAVHGVSAPHP
jgi:hypothetical protein